MTLRYLLVVALAIVTLPLAAGAWNRSPAVEFADLPHPLRNPEGLTVDRSSGEFYVADFDYRLTSKTGRIAVFDRSGRLLRVLSLNSSPMLLGLAFNSVGVLFVANTANDTVVQIPVADGVPGTPTVFVNSINGPDGLIIDGDDNLWVVANQADEIVVVDPSGKGIAKLGDFDGIARDGSPRGLLF